MLLIPEEPWKSDTKVDETPLLGLGSGGSRRQLYHTVYNNIIYYAAGNCILFIEDHRLRDEIKIYQYNLTNHLYSEFMSFSIIPPDYEYESKPFVFSPIYEGGKYCCILNEVTNELLISGGDKIWT